MSSNSENHQEHNRPEPDCEIPMKKLCSQKPEQGSDSFIEECRKCPTRLRAFYWTVNSCSSNSISASTNMLPSEDSTEWRSKEMHVAFGKKLATLQFKMLRNVRDGGLDMQLSIKGVGDMPKVDTHKYKYGLELHLDGVPHHSAETVMVECNESACEGTVNYHVVRMVNEDVPAFNSATVTVRIAKTEHYCTPCAKAVDYFGGCRGRTLHHVVAPRPDVQQTDIIKSLPSLIRAKIFTLVGNQIKYFGSVAGVCREWWMMAYDDKQRYFSRDVYIFADFAHSIDITTPMRLATIMSVCHNQVRNLSVDMYEPTSNTLTITADNRRTFVEHKKKLKCLAVTDLPKLRTYDLRVSHKCNEPNQHKDAMAFFDRCMPTLLEVNLTLQYRITHAQQEELKAAVDRSDNVAEFKLNGMNMLM